MNGSNRKSLQSFIMFAMTLLTLIIAGCGSEEALPEQIIRPVRTITAFTAGGFQTRTFSGTIQSSRESNLSFKVPGTVDRIFVKVGDRVRKGKLLAQLDDRDYDLQVQQASSALKQAEVQLRNDKDTYERFNDLYVNQNVSKSDLEGVKAKYESTRYLVDGLKKQLEQAQRQLSYTRLTAPFDGIVSYTSTEKEVVAAGTPIITLTSDRILEVVVPIPAQLITQIHEGDSVAVSSSDVTSPGICTEIAYSTARTSTYPVTVTITDRDNRLRPGMEAEVTFTFNDGSGDDYYLIPAHAVLSDSKGKYVFIAVPEEGDLARVERRDVMTGDIVRDGIRVSNGLKEGDRVIVAGMTRVYPDMQVKLQAGGE